MTKIKIKKMLVILVLGSLAIINITNTSAVQIGTGSVTGTGAYDSSINWNGTYTGSSASGSVSNILINASVDPSLNIEISTGAIDLGNLVSGVTTTGSLQIEVGSNAVNGILITARSGSGGLTNTSDNSVQINNLLTDSVQENYTFSSLANVVNDSSFGDFSIDGDSNLSPVEINNNLTEHKIYGTNRPEDIVNVDDLEFFVAAKITAETPAGEYQDKVTFTVTGNF